MASQFHHIEKEVTAHVVNEAYKATRTIIREEEIADVFVERIVRAAVLQASVQLHQEAEQERKVRA